MFPRDDVVLAGFNGLAAARTRIDDGGRLGHRHHLFTHWHAVVINGRAGWLSERRGSGSGLVPERGARRAPAAEKVRGTQSYQYFPLSGRPQRPLFFLALAAGPSGCPTSRTW